MFEISRPGEFCTCLDIFPLKVVESEGPFGVCPPGDFDSDHQHFWSGFILTSCQGQQLRPFAVALI